MNGKPIKGFPFITGLIMIGLFWMLLEFAAMIGFVVLVWMLVTR